jgi:hypothetical protein
MVPRTQSAPVAPPPSGKNRTPELRPKRIPTDPVRDLEKLLKAGKEPAKLWQMVSTCGFFYLLSNAKLAAPSPGQKLEECNAAYQEMQGFLEKRGASDAPASAICVHPTLSGWANAAQHAICRHSWFLDPSVAVVIAADPEDLEAHTALLRQPMVGQGNNDDPLAASQWVAEQLMPPSPDWKFEGLPPVRLVSDIKPGESWGEVYLTPRCLGLVALEVLPAVVATRVGLHITRGNLQQPA